MFDDVLLEPEQQELLVALVEAARAVPRDQRQKFVVFRPMGSPDQVHHPGLPDNGLTAYMGDFEARARASLLALTYGSKGTPQFDATPQGFAYYAEMKRRTGHPIQRTEADVRHYLDADEFRGRYPCAYGKWTEAEALLWDDDSARRLTTIGHLCREAMQEFTAVLVDRYRPAEPPATRPRRSPASGPSSSNRASGSARPRSPSWRHRWPIGGR